MGCSSISGHYWERLNQGFPLPMLDACTCQLHHHTSQSCSSVRQWSVSDVTCSLRCQESSACSTLTTKHVAILVMLCLPCSVMQGACMRIRSVSKQGRLQLQCIKSSCCVHVVSLLPCRVSVPFFSAPPNLEDLELSAQSGQFPRYTAVEYDAEYRDKRRH